MTYPNGDGTWLRWIVGILLGIVVLMAGAWANDVRDTLNSVSREQRIMDVRLSRIETAMGLKPWKKAPEEDE